MDRRTLLLALAALPFALPALAQSVNVSADQHATSPGLRSAQGRFTQTNPDRTTQTGTFYLQKPGRIRFEYDKPEGRHGHRRRQVGRRLRPEVEPQPDPLPLDKTPLSLLLRDRLSASPSPASSKAPPATPSGTDITVVDPRTPKEGRMVMSFTDSPIRSASGSSPPRPARPPALPSTTSGPASSSTAASSTSSSPPPATAEPPLPPARPPSPPGCRGRRAPTARSSPPR